MKRNDHLMAAFITKTPIHCVYIAGSAEKFPVRVDIDRLTIPPREGNKFIFWRRYWLASDRRARALLDAFTQASRHEQKRAHAQWFSLTVDQADERLRHLARTADLALTANNDVMARASAVVERYLAKLADMGRAGDLKALNRSYKALRVANQKLGRLTLTYEDWLDQQLTSVFDAIVAQTFAGATQAVEDGR